MDKTTLEFSLALVAIISMTWANTRPVLTGVPG
jgi:hypothetical protein